VALFASISGCGDANEAADRVKQMAGTPSVDQVLLDPLSIPKFAHELPIPRVFAPSIRHDPTRREYTISVKQTTVQLLPPGFPATTVLAYGGDVEVPNSRRTEFVRSVPGPVIENVRGVRTVIHWRNQIDTPHFLPVDPTLHWANPLGLEPPTRPFLPFPPGYADAQFPVAHVTHTHGLEVLSHADGVAEQWFTPSPGSVVGPSFVTRDYVLPNTQPSTHLFYHDHVMGATRLGVYSGLVGAAYFIRDPENPLDQRSSPLPRGEYEIPLVIFDRSFYTDGELRFPRTSVNPGNAYWQPGDGANTVAVNGKVWPNLNVERRQYRFRVVAAGNARTFNVTLDNGGTRVPFTIIGSDGGYLPAPVVVNNVQVATSERADILVDFSGFAPGTQIRMLNAGADPNTLGTIMRFTVLDGDAVSPPPLPEFPERPVLVADTPVRIKTFHSLVDADGNVQRATDGLDFSAPPTEFALVGSTEEWNIVNLGGGSHQTHLHLIEFQVLNRQAFDVAGYVQRWQLLNGFRPVTRPIVVDPTPFLNGNPLPPLPYETGWKDTVRTPGGQITRFMVRWAPQESEGERSFAGRNLYSFDPTSGPGYVWHCHVLGHEDNDMMRPLRIVNAWRAGVRYDAGTVITYRNVNYRVRVHHRSLQWNPPPTRFDRYERVNNNDGAWEPQIIYAVGDRVLFEGQLYMADVLHQAQRGEPPAARPDLWHPFPMTACGQLQELCHDGTTDASASCHDLGHGGDEAACLARFTPCLAACSRLGGEHAHGASPCSGLCADPVSFEVPDGTVYDSPRLGSAPGCFETTSEIVSGSCSPSHRALTVNGREMPCNGRPWPGPLPTQRNHGYCLQVERGRSFRPSRFSVQ
jgi:FtsP/CotA-like multicopper oxidase with cupredoxin domain